MYKILSCVPLMLVILCITSNQPIPDFNRGVVVSKRQINEKELHAMAYTVPIYEEYPTDNCVFEDNFGGKFIAPIKTYDIGDSLKKHFK